MDATSRYRPDLALVHHRGYGSYADGCAEGVLAAIEPVRRTGGTVLELGCGSGALTRHLVAAGHRVLGTDASSAMLDLAREAVPDASGIRRLVLPGDPLPPADAIVSVGHVLNYLDDEAAIDQALVTIAAALRPGGILALDVCDLRWAEVRRDQPAVGRVGDDWAVITEFSVPAPDRFVREITVFLRNEDGSWRRDHERHGNVLIDTARLPRLLARHGIQAELGTAFGDYTLPDGLVALVGHRPA